MKYYEFRYKSKGAKVFGSILNVCSFFIYPIIVIGAFLFVLHLFRITDNFELWMYFAFILLSFIISIIFTVKYFVSLKGVFIYDEYLEIERHYINDLNPVANIKIYYKDIKSIYSSRQRIPLGSWKAKKQIVTGGDLSYYVEIILNGGKEFFFPVKNQEEFIKDLLFAVNQYRRSRGLDEI